MLAAGGLYSLFLIGQTTFRWLYYGELLPNTYVLKLTGMPILERLKNGVRFVRSFFLESALLLLVVYAGMVPFKKTNWYLFSFTLTAIAYQIWIGGEPWFYWRIISPSMPLLLILFIQTVLLVAVSLSNRLSTARGNQAQKKNFFSRYPPESVVISITLLTILVTNIRFLPEISLITVPYDVQSNQRNVNIALALGQLTTDDATIGITWAGTIPYYTGRVAVDFLGKSDKHIAQLPPDMSGRTGFKGMSSVPGHNKYDLNYSIKTLQPTYIERLDWGTQDLSEWGQSRYVEVEYNDLRLLLLKDSEAVRWERID
jgi:hypothetical protein